MKHLESFGSKKHYAELIPLVENNKYLWRKVARILSKLRRQYLTYCHPLIREQQMERALVYVNQSILDTVMSAEVATALKLGLAREFEFVFA